jgi:putative transposase
MGYPFNVRKRQRLDGYDYRQANTYFVTFRTFGSASLFGEVTEKGIVPSEAGQMVDAHIRALPGTYADVRVLEWVVMPDHVHILLTILPGDSPNAERPSLAGSSRRLRTPTFAA